MVPTSAASGRPRAVGIEAIRGQPAQGKDDLRPHEGDLPVQVAGAERDLGGGGRAISLALCSLRWTGVTLGQAGQVEVAMERSVREPGAGQPRLEGASAGAGVRKWPLPGGRPRRLPDDHQALPGVAMEDRQRRRDEPSRDAERAGGDLALHGFQRKLWLASGSRWVLASEATTGQRHHAWRRYDAHTGKLSAHSALEKLMAKRSRRLDEAQADLESRVRCRVLGMARDRAWGAR